MLVAGTFWERQGGAVSPEELSAGKYGSHPHHGQKATPDGG